MFENFYKFSWIRLRNASKFLKYVQNIENGLENEWMEDKRVQLYGGVWVVV